jgi:hypothetical protein
MNPYQEFQKELTSLLNRTGMDNWCNTPDFLLSDYLTNCLSAYREAHEKGKQFNIPEAQPCLK